MESLIEAVDTHGILGADVFKINIEQSAASVTLEDVENGNKNGEIVIKHDNIDYSSIPGLIPGEITYKFVLAYNGTMSRNSGTYAQIVLDRAGAFDTVNIPTFKYSPEGLVYTDTENIGSGTVLNINFLTSEANILQWRGVPVGGNNTGFDISSYTYPFTITKLPNRDGQVTFLDGWYTATFAIYKNAHLGNRVTKNQIFGYEGEVYTASKTGILGASGGTLFVSNTGNPQDGSGVVLNRTTYKEFILDANTITGVETNTPASVVNTQILALPELNQSIIDNVLVGATSTECDDKCLLADWQKLQQKKIASHIQFLNGNFRKCQVIVESSRVVCYNRNLKNCN